MTALAFGAPAVLWALLLLPGLWWLLRAVPPRPRDVAFAPTRLLGALRRREETPAHTPWWLMLVRLALATLVILALAQPVLRPEPPAAAGQGAVLMVIDDTFAAAADWEERVRTAERVLAEADAAERGVILVPASDAAAPLTALTPRQARERLRGLQPQPWRSRRAALAARLAESGVEAGTTVWLSDGLASEATQDDTAFMAALAAASGRVVAYVPQPGGIVGISKVETTPEGMAVSLLADAAPGGAPRRVRVLDRRGFVLAEAQAAFAAGAADADARIALPTQLRNDALRVVVEGERTAAAVRLLDDRFRRRTVGLISGGSVDLAQPLLSPLHYLRAALAPSSDLREPTARELPAAIDELIDAGTSVIILADVGTLLPSTREALTRWVGAGGVLLRFAGPRAADGVDELVPVRMRPGTRTLGGTLSWEEPQPLAEFAEAGPFADLAVPDDVTVRRQLLAEPSIALTQRSWATLADGTPVVTGRRLGEGALVFVHVTADTSWSTLPLSGAFVEMLRRVVALSAAGPVPGGEGQGDVEGEGAGAALPPYRVLDGAGRLVAPGPLVEPLSGTPEALGPRHPPGLYGTDGAFRAVNLLAEGARLAPIDAAALGGTAVREYASGGPRELKGLLLAAAAGLLVIDSLAILLLMGAWRRPVAAGLALALLLPLAPRPTAAQTPDEAAVAFAMRASLKTRLAYVASGDAALDAVSEAGLAGLSRALAQRTAVEPAEPMGVNLERDDLAFFPLLYWPVSAATARPSEAAIAKVDAFMKNGGTILFDTRDQSAAGVLDGASPATLALRRILDGLDIPPLEPVPLDHVLTKTFYLLDAFPGRWAGSPLWVEALQTERVEDRPARAGDGVSPILITANDFASAWAIDESGGFLFPTVPNDPYQREIAIRAGINIAIYTMTGNYKADQVHIPALLERLGQ